MIHPRIRIESTISPSRIHFTLLIDMGARDFAEAKDLDRDLEPVRALPGHPAVHMDLSW